MSETKNKIIYIHVGMHKTGTTSLQYFFSSERKYFIEQHKLYYPPAKGMTNHRHKSLFPIQRKEFQEIVGTAEKLGCSTILLSNESLAMHGLDDHCLNIIRETAPEFTVKFIIYVRRIDDFCKAWFAELHKSAPLSGKKNYAVFMNKAHRRKAFFLYPSRLIEKCIGQVGRENVLSRNYAPKLLVKQNIIEDVLVLLDLTVPSEKKKTTHFNFTLPPACLPYMTASSYSSSGYGYSEVQIRKKMAAAFAYAGPGKISENIQAAIAAEIENLDANYLPNYKQSFGQRPLSLQFPELQARPEQIYQMEMLHTIYRRITWPERMVWRIGVTLFFFFSRFDSLRKLLLRLVPDKRE